MLVIIALAVPFVLDELPQDVELRSMTTMKMTLGSHNRCDLGHAERSSSVPPAKEICMQPPEMRPDKWIT
jgi:hypothetical protein